MKKSIFLVVFSLFLLLVGCQSSDGANNGAANNDANNNGDNAESAENAEVKLIAGHATEADTPYDLGLKKFKEVVEEISDGNITVEVHPIGEIGGHETEFLESVTAGTVDLTVVAPGYMSRSVKEVDFFALPYLYENDEKWEAVVDGEVGDKITEYVETQSDLKVMGYWKAGKRYIFSKDPIEEPSDLNNIKIRVQDSEVNQKVWGAFGAQPVATSFEELYQALQTGVADASENDPTNILAMKFHEVAPHISLTGHDIATRFFLMNADKFDSLTDEQKEWVETAAKEATEYERQVDDEMGEESLDQLVEEGATLYEVDSKAFEEVVRPVQDEMAEKMGLTELLDIIRGN